MEEQKLTIMHLAPYLPYKLRVKRGEMKPIIMNVGAGSSAHWIGIGAVISLWKLDTIPSKPMPVLHPLSDLTKEELRNKGFWHHIDFLTDEKRNPIEAPFEMVQYLFSKHFDVFGLIEKGLAVDINDIKNS